MGWLIAARAVAGAGGAGLLTVSSVITTDLTSLRSRGHYQGMSPDSWSIATVRLNIYFRLDDDRIRCRGVSRRTRVRVDR